MVKVHVFDIFTYEEEEEELKVAYFYVCDDQMISI